MRHNFKKLKIWKNAMELCDAIFKITSTFPKSEIYSLTSQINRSAISVPSNIAEGSSRSSNKDFSRFLEISLGSLYELQTQIILAKFKKLYFGKSIIRIRIENGGIAKNDFRFSKHIKINII